MKYAIIGSGNIGSTLARAFAAKNIGVLVANTRGPASAYEAGIIFLAVPFRAHADVAKQRADWNGKIIVDVTNAIGLSPEEQRALGGLSSDVVARAFVGARVVKAFNHLPARQLGTNADVPGQRAGRRARRTCRSLAMAALARSRSPSSQTQTATRSRSWLKPAVAPPRRPPTSS
jgi:hypothetical protein